MNVLKKIEEQRLNRQTEQKLEEAPIKALDRRISSVLIRHVLSNSELIRYCRDIKILEDRPNHLIPVIDNPTTYDDYMMVSPETYIIETSIDPSIDNTEEDNKEPVLTASLTAFIGKQMAIIIDESIEQRRYGLATLALIEDMEIARSTDMITGEKLIRIYFKFATVQNYI